MARLTQLLVAAGISLLVVLSVMGCGGGSSSPTAGGCGQTVLDVEGRIVPGSSGLTCDGVRQVIGGSVPATPGGYLLETTEPDVTWRCHMYPSSGNSTNLLSCSHGSKTFAIRRVK
jgi:hypothetical protein